MKSDERREYLKKHQPASFLSLTIEDLRRGLTDEQRAWLKTNIANSPSVGELVKVLTEQKPVQVGEA
jgi:hypothetical protein